LPHRNVEARDRSPAPCAAPRYIKPRPVIYSVFRLGLSFDPPLAKSCAAQGRREANKPPLGNVAPDQGAIRAAPSELWIAVEKRKRRGAR
jgi:hypothetical protein